MDNQHTQQSETSAGQVKKGNGGKRLPMAGLGFGIIATASIVILLMISSCASSSRLSTQSEIKAQKEFQEKWNKEEKDAKQKWASRLKPEEQKADSILKTGERK